MLESLRKKGYHVTVLWNTKVPVFSISGNSYRLLGMKGGVKLTLLSHRLDLVILRLVGRLSVVYYRDLLLMSLIGCMFRSKRPTLWHYLTLLFLVYKIKISRATICVSVLCPIACSWVNQIAATAECLANHEIELWCFILYSAFIL